MTRRWIVDTAERVVFTTAEAFAASLILAGAHVLSLSALHAAAIAGLSAGLTVVKAALAGATTASSPPAGFLPVPASPDALSGPHSPAQPPAGTPGPPPATPTVVTGSQGGT